MHRRRRLNSLLMGRSVVSLFFTLKLNFVIAIENIKRGVLTIVYWQINL